MKNQFSNDHENMNSNDSMHFDNREQHMVETKHEGKFYEYLYNLREENPWDEKDFDTVFMYL